MKDEVEEVLESIRPMLIKDGGNVELVDVDDGVVKVRLVGACVSCSSSTMTCLLYTSPRPRDKRGGGMPGWG